MNRRCSALLLALALLSPVSVSLWAGAADPPRFSKLWGRHGERWTPESRLPDFSLAGYRRGEEAFRIPRESISVRDFGATGDGRHDDTAAFKKAIAAGARKLVLVPPGRYLLSDVLEVSHSGLVLHGAGPDRTVLQFVRPLEELRPRPAKTDGNRPTSGWSWGGGLVQIGGRAPAQAHAVRVTQPARRGVRQLTVEHPAFQQGDEIELLVQDDAHKTLLRHLYRDQPGNISGLNRWKCTQVFRVRAVAGTRLTLDRPLRFDVRLEWHPTVRRWRPAVTDVGLESMAFEFPPNRYGGHFREVGFNPVVIEATAAHCWLRDLRIRNADSGPYVNGSFCTLEKIQLEAAPERRSPDGHTGHHGITFYGHDNLCRDFNIQTRFIHDLTVQSAMGCVFASGRGIDLCFDHHRWAPYENLFTDLDAGSGQRLFTSGGGGQRGAHTAAGATFWNIRTEQPVPGITRLGNAHINVVAVRLRENAQQLPNDLWYEPIPPGHITPANLYEAMLARRLNSRRSSP